MEEEKITEQFKIEAFKKIINAAELLEKAKADLRLYSPVLKLDFVINIKFPDS